MASKQKKNISERLPNDLISQSTLNIYACNKVQTNVGRAFSNGIKTVSDKKLLCVTVFH